MGQLTGILTATMAESSRWCLYCPDLIVEGETAATSGDLMDPLGAQGYAHADCASAMGWMVDGVRGPDIDGRGAFREFIRAHGPIEIDLRPVSG